MPPIQKTITRFQPYRAVGNHITFNGAPGVLSQSVPAQANGVLIQSTTQNIWIRLDGGNPAVGTGFQIRAGDPAVLIPLNAGSVITFIEETATAKINFQYVILE